MNETLWKLRMDELIKFVNSHVGNDLGWLAEKPMTDNGRNDAHYIYLLCHGATWEKAFGWKVSMTFMKPMVYSSDPGWKDQGKQIDYCMPEDLLKMFEEKYNTYPWPETKATVMEFNLLQSQKPRTGTSIID